MTFPSSVKTWMALNNHPHYSTYTHVTTEVKRVFNSPTKLRKYRSGPLSVSIPLKELLTLTEMDKIITAIGRGACGNEAERLVLIDMARFISAESGLRVGIELIDSDNRRQGLANVDGDFERCTTNMASIIESLADGNQLVLRLKLKGEGS